MNSTIRTTLIAPDAKGVQTISTLASDSVMAPLTVFNSRFTASSWRTLVWSSLLSHPGQNAVSSHSWGSWNSIPGKEIVLNQWAAGCAWAGIMNKSRWVYWLSILQCRDGIFYDLTRCRGEAGYFHSLSHHISPPYNSATNQTECACKNQAFGFDSLQLLFHGAVVSWNCRAGLELLYHQGSFLLLPKVGPEWSDLPLSQDLAWSPQIDATWRLFRLQLQHDLPAKKGRLKNKGVLDLSWRHIAFCESTSTIATDLVGASKSLHFWDGPLLYCDAFLLLYAIVFFLLLCFLLHWLQTFGGEFHTLFVHL